MSASDDDAEGIRGSKLADGAAVDTVTNREDLGAGGIRGDGLAKDA